MSLDKSLYRRLMSDGDDVEGEISQGRDVHLSRYNVWKHSLITYTLAALVLSIALLGTLIFLVFVREPMQVQCLRKLSLYSPALEAVEYIDYDFANNFNSTSIYRGPPVPEREAAWVKLTEKHAIEIPVDKIAYLNRSEADDLQHVPAEVGTGYTAAIEVFHQLHCLNMVRMYTWWVAGKYPHIPHGMTDDPLRNRMHVDHCIETLRLALQCQSDVTPLLVKNGGPLGRKADFSTHHRCRNFEKVEAWIDENWTVY